MKKIILVLCMSMVTVFRSSFGQDDLDIFLLIGQSNMAGRAEMDLNVEQDTAAIPNTWLFKDSADWVPARNPLNWYSTYRKADNMQKIGPGYGFSLRVQEMMPGRQIGLVVQARGGTSIDLWERGDELYDNAVEKARQARASGTLQAVLWHQGESDNGSADTYLDRVTILIASLREDLGIDTLPFIAGQLLNISDKYAPFNSIITDLPGLVPHTGVVRTDSTMGSFDGGTHFDREAQIELGIRYADIMLSMIDFNQASAITSFANTAASSGSYLHFNRASGHTVYMEFNGRSYTIPGQLRIIRK